MLQTFSSNNFGIPDTPSDPTTLTVDIADDGTVTLIGRVSNATVILPDVQAGGSIVHVVDQALVPFGLPGDFPAPPAPEPEEEV